MNWLTAALAFLGGLYQGWRNRQASRAGAKLPRGEAEVKAADANVKAIEEVLARSAPVTPAAPAPASTVTVSSDTPIPAPVPPTRLVN